MNVALRSPMTLADFLAWEERQPRKFEFDGLQPVAMTGVRAAHAAIQRNLLSLLATALRGKPCQSFGSDLKVQVAGRIRYPDAFVVCTPLANDALVVTDPVVIFEILSDTTEHVDLVEKNDEYRATASVQRYVILEQTHVGGIVFSRDGLSWNATPVRAGATIDMPEIGVSLTMAGLYEGLSLSPDQPPVDA